MQGAIFGLNNKMSIYKKQESVANVTRSPLCLTVRCVHTGKNSAVITVQMVLVIYERIVTVFVDSSGPDLLNKHFPIGGSHKPNEVGAILLVSEEQTILIQRNR